MSGDDFPQAIYSIQRSQLAAKLWNRLFFGSVEMLWESDWILVKDILQFTWIHCGLLSWAHSMWQLHPSCHGGCGKHLLNPGWNSVLSNGLAQQGLILLASAPGWPAQPVSERFYKGELGGKEIITLWLRARPGLWLGWFDEWEGTLGVSPLRCP